MFKLQYFVIIFLTGAVGLKLKNTSRPITLNSTLIIWEGRTKILDNLLADL